MAGEAERRPLMAENKFETREMLARCVSMSRLQGVLGGKWKILILWYVAFYRIPDTGSPRSRPSCC